MNKGRIYFDGEVFCWVRSGGLYSAVHIFAALRKHFDVRVFIPANFDHLRPSLQSDYALLPEEIITLPFTRRVLLSLKLLGFPPPGLKLHDADVIFHTNTNVYRSAKRQICICHDLLALTAQRHYSFRDRMTTGFQVGRLRNPRIAVICHSKNVANHVSRLAGVNGDRLTTVPLGPVSLPNRNSMPVRPPLSHRPVEALCVSAYHPRKNFERLISHVRRLNGELPNSIRLTLAGPHLRTHLSSEEDEWIRVRDFVPENEYSAMFYQSDVYINPSAAEGFGITNLDAQGCGLPVLCNNIEVFHEILGDSAAYFDAEDYSSFSRGILKLIQDSQFRQELVDAGFENVQGPTYVENIDRILVPWLLRFFPQGTSTRSAT